MLKSRATRYVERLTDSVVFRDFLRAFEIRIAFGFVAIVLSFAVYIGDPTLTIDASPANALIFAWLFVFLASIALLFDSLFTARVVLD